MAGRLVRYREVRYEVGFRGDSYEDKVTFFPLLSMDGEQVGRGDAEEEREAPMDDPKLMSLAYGAVQAWCDQENASLQDRGMNRVREVL